MPTVFYSTCNVEELSIIRHSFIVICNPFDCPCIRFFCSFLTAASLQRVCVCTKECILSSYLECFARILWLLKRSIKRQYWTKIS